MRLSVGLFTSVALTWGVLSCSAAAPAPRPAPPAATAVSPPPLEPAPDGQRRLTRRVVPQRYELEFTIDPSRESFSGRAQILVEVTEPTQRIDLHADGLNVTLARAVRETGAASTTRPAAPADLRTAQVTTAGGALVLSFAEALVGRWQLELEYSAPLEETPDSLYRVQERGAWYAFTQFEAQAARAAFPCFDEPQFKTPFSVTIKAPQGLSALSNAPLDWQGAEGQMWVHHFHPTRPLPTYLVALAVGQFERRGANIGPVPHSIYTVAGKSQEADYVLAKTPKILGALTDYFGSAYPFQKLDQLGVPHFRAGAMENAGLITYRESLLLLDERKASPQQMLRSQSVVAHELAHMWFGNLVTMQWWDDLWLNEAFATWMANKVMGQVAPEYEPQLMAVKGMLRVMQEDALASAEPVRKTIANRGDVENAFDPITYHKGMAVLRMLESWMGPEPFREGVRAYLKKYAWANADMSGFLQALESQSAAPVEAVATSFITQPGTPLVGVELSCKAGAPPSVRLTQSRYVPLGIERSNGLWRIPVCLKLLYEKGEQVQCVDMDQPQQSFPLPDKRCPQAVYPNASSAGYYHFALPDSDIKALGKRFFRRLSLEEQVAFPHQLGAQLAAGTLGLRQYIQALEALPRRPHRLVVDALMDSLSQLGRLWPVGQSREPLQRLTRKLLGAERRAITLLPTTGEPEAHRLLRARLYGLWARLGPKDAELKREAQRVAELFKQGKEAELPMEHLSLVLPLVAEQDDAAFHALLVGRLGAASPTLRDTLIYALGSFRSEALLHQSYDLLLAGTIRPTELWSLRAGTLTSEPRAALFWKWFLANEQSLKEALGPRGAVHLPGLASTHCTSEGLSWTKQHFADPAAYGPGADKHVRLALERIGRCVALREHLAPQLPGAL